MMILHSHALEEWLATLTEVKGVCGRVIERSPGRKAEEAKGEQESEKQSC
jgi:hypothetical protein